MTETSDQFSVGQGITVIEDPQGELCPQPPGQADATGDALGAGALALVALGAVGWMTWRDRTPRDAGTIRRGSAGCGRRTRP